ncbi:MAG TPA: sigma-70 family RNA polymerase sigma factor [Terriglobales bacterium]|nr:sigma-70 family RNA polymerase sigma factor [Terriglobales bacterium]
MNTWFATWECSLPQVSSTEVTLPRDLSMDHDAFTAFYERTARPLWAYLARVSGNRALADDLLQECYLRFLSARIPEDELACRRYLFRIGTNLMRDHWRRPNHTALEDLPQEPAALSDSIRTEALDAQQVLASAFPSLRPRERQLLWLAYAEGASHREIAQITGLRETSIRLLLFRARHKLARAVRRQAVKAGRAL